MYLKGKIGSIQNGTGMLAVCGLQSRGLETGEASRVALGKGVYGSMYGDLPDNYVIGITVKYGDLPDSYVMGITVKY